MVKTTIASFDKTQLSQSNYDRPEKYSDLLKLCKGPLIARGAGLSYCNAASIEQGLCVDMRSFNRILSFDADNGSITVEAGMTVGDLNNFVINHGWQLPVLPGYPMITIGGCIAFNVHGKSQYKIGLFQDWVEDLTIYHPAYGEIKCSEKQQQIVFDLTIGGMGFTGIILSATLRLKKIPGNTMQIKTFKVAGVNEALQVMSEKANDYEYVYSWNNFNLNGKSFGRGIVYLEKIQPGFSQKVKTVSFRNRLLPPRKIPAILNRVTIYWMCFIYYTMNAVKSSASNQSLSASSFPIYGKEIYYHLFGKKGFREYQVLFSYDNWEKAMEEIQKLIRDTKTGIALASLKIFKGSTHNISFSGEGVCLAIDIPNNKKSIDFFNRLDEITVRYKGLINLSKDSRAGYDLVKQIYTGYTGFKDQVNAFDPQRIFVSDLRDRLKI